MIRQILDFSRRSVMEMQTLDSAAACHRGTARPAHAPLPGAISRLRWTSRRRLCRQADPTSMQQMLMNLAVNASRRHARGRAPHDGIVHVVVAANAAPGCRHGAGAWVLHGRSPTRARHCTGRYAAHLRALLHDQRKSAPARDSAWRRCMASLPSMAATSRWRARPAPATFVIYLPALVVASDAAAPVAGRPLPPCRTAAARRSWWLRTTRRCAMTLVEFLETLEYTVPSATDGTDALHLLDAGAEQPAPILSDVVMPHMGGVAPSRIVPAQSAASRSSC